MPGGVRVKLYFDKQTGLLVRQARFTDTPVIPSAKFRGYATTKTARKRAAATRKLKPELRFGYRTGLFTHDIPLTTAMATKKISKAP
jgi:hypothetical protein